MKLDAKGQACPIPVMMAKKAMREAPDQSVFISVDNFTATENLSKMAKGSGYDVKVNKNSDTDYEVELIPGTQEKAKPIVCGEMSFEYIVVISSDGMGEGDKAFSQTLLDNFIYTLTEQENKPVKMIFYNHGVKKTVKGSTALEDIRKLESQGVTVESCGLCLKNYGLDGDLAVGSITNMYSIAESMCTYRVVKP